MCIFFGVSLNVLGACLCCLRVLSYRVYQFVRWSDSIFHICKNALLHTIDNTKNDVNKRDRNVEKNEQIKEFSTVVAGLLLVHCFIIPFAADCTHDEIHSRKGK